MKEIHTRFTPFDNNEGCIQIEVGRCGSLDVWIPYFQDRLITEWDDFSNGIIYFGFMIDVINDNDFNDYTIFRYEFDYNMYSKLLRKLSIGTFIERQ